MAIRYLTAGESHGQCLTAILEGIPSGLSLTEKEINVELARRQHTFGRGERQQYIENDQVKFLSGIRHGETLGSPITLVVQNKDWENWQKIMSIEAAEKNGKFSLLRPRPGHADLVGVLKFNRADTRDILERASARETAVRTAVGTVCRKFLSLFNIQIYSWVIEIGGVKAKLPDVPPSKLNEMARESPVQCPDKTATKKMMEKIQDAKSKGDTLGGVYEVMVLNVPVGLGSHIQWDLKLDGLLAQAVMSIQAHKAVEFGRGFEFGSQRGSDVHDEIFYEQDKGFFRKTNNAGGVEGGMSNGAPILLRAAIKPLASLRKPLHSVNIKTKEAMKAEIVRSDVAPVAAAAVIAEAVVATTLAQQFSLKFGGDSLAEVQRNFENYQAYLKSF